MKFRKTLASTAVAFALVGFVGAPAVAGTIESWDTANVMTTPTLDADGNGFSYIYDQAPVAGGSTSGYIKFTPPESVAPGLEVENSAPPADGAAYSGGDVYNCIVASGSSSCNSEFQSGKRFKLDRTAFDPIDLVFNVDPQGVFPLTIDGSVNDALYKVFQKYGNNTGSSIDSFTVELGFGLGDAFSGSVDGDGLGFVDFGADPKENQFSSFYSAGLFGPGGTTKHPYIGYFSDERAGFNLDMVGEDLFQSNGMFGDYADLFGDWMSYSMAPDGYFYDHDGDPSTDALLMAHFNEDLNKWVINRGIDAAGDVVTLAEGNDGAKVDTVAEVEAALQTNTTLPACIPDVVNPPCLAGVDVVEDLAKFNLTYFLDVIDSELLAATYGDDITAFTLRITAVEAVPAPGALSLLGLGLLGLFGVKRRMA